MKPVRSLTTSLIFAITSSLTLTAMAEVPADRQAQRRTTHDALMQRRAEAMKKANAGKKDGKKDGVQTVKPGEIKYKPHKPRKRFGDLLDRSSIICWGGNWTLVPKNAVLHVPAAYRSRVDGKRSGKLLPWAPFLAKNRGWLQTHSVNIPQARGELGMDPKQVDVYKNSGRVVVAVCHHGPISVKPVKVADAVADAAGAK